MVTAKDAEYKDAAPPLFLVRLGNQVRTRRRAGADGSVGRFHVGSSHIGGPELWECNLQPGGHYDASPYPEGSEELFLVLAGRLRIETEGQSYVVDSGRSARLASDRPHSYHNDGDEAAAFVRVSRVTQPDC